MSGQCKSFLVWVMGGKLKDNEAIILKQFSKHGWTHKELTAVYDSRMMMEAGYFSRQRGFGNAGMCEKIYCAWMGKAGQIKLVWGNVSHISYMVAGLKGIHM